MRAIANPTFRRLLRCLQNSTRCRTWNLTIELVDMTNSKRACLVLGSQDLTCLFLNALHRVEGFASAVSRRSH